MSTILKALRQLEDEKQRGSESLHDEVVEPQRSSRERRGSGRGALWAGGALAVAGVVMLGLALSPLLSSSPSQPESSPPESSDAMSAPPPAVASAQRTAAPRPPAARAARRSASTPTLAAPKLPTPSGLDEVEREDSVAPPPLAAPVAVATADSPTTAPPPAPVTPAASPPIAVAAAAPGAARRAPAPAPPPQLEKAPEPIAAAAAEPRPEPVVAQKATRKPAVPASPPAPDPVSVAGQTAPPDTAQGKPAPWDASDDRAEDEAADAVEVADADVDVVPPSSDVAIAEVPRVEPNLEAIVLGTSWHPRRDRRSARLEVAGKSVEHAEGDRIDGFEIVEITPSAVVFEREGDELRRRVGEGR